MKISVNENKASGVSVVETLEMSQKPVVHPIERISAHNVSKLPTMNSNLEHLMQPLARLQDADPRA